MRTSKINNIKTNTYYTLTAKQKTALQDEIIPQRNRIKKYLNLLGPQLVEAAAREKLSNDMNKKIRENRYQQFEEMSIEDIKKYLSDIFNESDDYEKEAYKQLLSNDNDYRVYRNNWGLECSYEYFRKTGLEDTFTNYLRYCIEEYIPTYTQYQNLHENAQLSYFMLSLNKEIPMDTLNLPFIGDDLFLYLASRLAIQYEGSFAERKGIKLLAESYPSAKFSIHPILDTVLGVDVVMIYNDEVFQVHVTCLNKSIKEQLKRKGSYQTAHYREVRLNPQDDLHRTFHFSPKTRGFADMFEGNKNCHLAIYYKTIYKSNNTGEWVPYSEPYFPPSEIKKITSAHGLLFTGRNICDELESQRVFLASQHPEVVPDCWPIYSSKQIIEMLN